MAGVLRLLIQGLVFITLLTSPTLAIATLNPIQLSLPRDQRPNQITIHVVIPTNPDNRQACLSVLGEDYFSESCWLLNPNQAQYVKVFKSMPRGEYEGRGELTTTGAHHTDTLQFLVN